MGSVGMMPMQGPLDRGRQGDHSRAVQNESGSADAGTESGTGTIGADGAATFTGERRGARDHYTASYSGKLGAKGGRLAGQQGWTYDGKSYTHDCTMTVNPQ